MIAETSAWLTWAMSSGQALPRIPRRRVGLGGFRDILQRPGARAAVYHWWSRTLSFVESIHAD